MDPTGNLGGVGGVGMSQSTQIILATISALVSLIGTCFTAWIGLQMARIKEGVSENTEGLKQNNKVAREAKHGVANIALAQTLARDRLIEEQEVTRKKLEELVDGVTTTKKLVDGDRTYLLRQNALALRLLATTTKDSEDIQKAKEAEKTYAAHVDLLVQVEKEERERQEKSATDSLRSHREDKKTELEIKNLPKGGDLPETTSTAPPPPDDDGDKEKE